VTAYRLQHHIVTPAHSSHHPRQGFARVRRAGAGFMMVTRRAIETLRAGYPQLACVPWVRVRVRARVS
jgi:hypothetical protein